ncbi:MAG: hypothetical protein ABIW82_01050 [Dokdonella sp.]
MFPNVRRHATCFMSVFALCALAGCTMFNPRVREPNYAKPEQRASDYSTPTDWCPVAVATNGLFDASLCTSLAYAYNYQLRFSKAAATDATFRTTAGALAIPIGAAALYYGVTGIGTPHRIAGLSVGGAALYSSATWLSSTPKQKIYMAGAQATLCAMYAAGPFLLREDARARFDTEIDALSNADQKLVAVIDRAAAQSDGGALAAALSQARSVHQDASNLLGEAYEIAGAIARAGFVLRNRVDMIAAKVQDQLVDQEPSLQSLLSLIGSMNQTANTFAHATLQAPTPTTTAKDGIQAHGAPMLSRRLLDDLAAAVADVQSALLILRPDVTRHAELRTVASSINACQPAGAEHGFSVSPDVRAASVAKDKTLRFSVTNKVAVPTIAITGINADAIEAHTEVDGSNFAVIVKGVKVVADGSPILVIRDGTGIEFRETAISVTDAAAPTTPATTPAPKPAAVQYPACDNGAITADADKIKTIQHGLGLCSEIADAKQAGVLGPKTRTAIAQYQAAAAQTATGCVSSVLLMTMSQRIATNDPCTAKP